MEAHRPHQHHFPQRHGRAPSNATLTLPYTGEAAAPSAMHSIPGYGHSPPSLLGMSSDSSVTPRFIEHSDLAILDDPSLDNYPGIDSSNSSVHFAIAGSEQSLGPFPAHSSSHLLDPSDPVTFLENLRISNQPWSPFTAGTSHPNSTPAIGIIQHPNLRLSTLGRQKSPSHASGHRSNLDSGYGTWTISRKSQHEDQSLTPTQITSTETQDLSSPLSYQEPDTMQRALRNGRPPQPQTRISLGGPTASEATPSEGPATAHFVCPEPDCDYVAKTQSDSKKHAARHELKHVCDLPRCNRNGKGFATVNDLHRHQKSVHGTNQRRSKDYRCFALGCGKPDKVWPRLDNFKQHLQRMHGGEDVDELVRRSEEWYEDSGRGEAEAETTKSVKNSMSPLTPTHPRVPFAPSAGLTSTRSEIGDYGHSHMLGRLNTTNIQQPQNLQFLSPTSRPAPHGGQGHLPGPKRQPPNKSNRVAPYQIPNRPSAFEPGSMQRSRSQQTQQMRYQTQQRSQDHLPRFPLQQGSMEPQLIQAPMPDNSSMDYHVNFMLEIPDIPGRPLTFPRLSSEMQQDVRLQEDFFSDTMDTEQYETTQNAPGEQDALLTGMDIGVDAHSPYTPTCSQQTSSPNVRITVNDYDHTSEESSKQISKLITDQIQTFLEQHTSQRDKESILQQLPQLSQKVIHSLKSITSRKSSSVDAHTTVGTELSTNVVGKTCPHTGKQWFKCEHPGCGKIKQRLSELKKHQKRHTRPYGCTFDNCRKRFGSKNDWKRHENTQHEQQECWRCDCKQWGTEQVCARLFWTDRKFFREHLRSDHGLSEAAQIDVKLKGRRIPRRNHTRFWCGFCDEIVPMTTCVGGSAAENERLNHINAHLDKDRKIGQWIELGAGGRTKDQVAEEHDKKKGPKQIESDEEDEEDKNEDDGEEIPDSQATSTSAPSSSSASPEDAGGPSSQIGGARSAQMRRSSDTEMHWVPGTTAQQHQPSQQREQYLQTQPQPIQEAPRDASHLGYRASGGEEHASYAICCQCDNAQLLALGSKCWSCNHNTRPCPLCKKRRNPKSIEM